MCPLCFVVLMARIFLQFRRFALLQLLLLLAACSFSASAKKGKCRRTKQDEEQASKE
jgi:hypothetical protein